MDLPLVFQKVAIALGLGLLVGLQRERVQAQLAGIRTFALITVFGAVSALLASSFGGWVLGFGAAGVTALFVVGNVTQPEAKEGDPGLTTEVAALLMYGVGAYVVVGPMSVAVAVGGGVALLLHFKAPMHEFVARIGQDDLKAIMQFVLIALVILPILPNQTYGPYDVFNPQEAWLMVVLIVGISLGGYVASKLFGQTAGTLLGGVLGGLVSSTATTISYSQRARSVPAIAPLAAVVVIIASTVVFVRVLTEIAVVAPTHFWHFAAPLSVMLGWMAVLSLSSWLFSRGQPLEQSEQHNPAELKSALIFGGLYALVLLAIAAARDFFGATGLYGVAILSGLHDVDALTLSTARLVEHGQLELDVGWRAILTGCMANLFVKTILVVLFGHWRLTVRIAPLFLAGFLGGVLLLFFWPE